MNPDFEAALAQRTSQDAQQGGSRASTATRLARQGDSSSVGIEPHSPSQGALRSSLTRSTTDPGMIGPPEHPDWSLRMINEGITLPELLLDSNVSDSDFARAARANLVTKFPLNQLNKVRFVAGINEQYIENWRIVILSISIYYRQYKKFPTQSDIYNFLERKVDYDIIAKYLSDPNTDPALSELGVNSPTQGLSERQMLAISLLTSFTDQRPLTAKLKSIGVKDWEFNNWLGYPKFQTAYRKITEDLLNEAQPALNTALVQLATGNAPNQGGRPDLSSIKFLMEINGRWDPASRQVMDMRSFMTKVVDILTDELSENPALLQRIGQRLAGAAGSIGNTQALSIEGSTE